MDADQLRLILLLAGMALVVAIYLWDRYKRSRTRLKGLSLRQARRLQRELADQEPVIEDEIISFRAVEKNRDTVPEERLDETKVAPESFFADEPENEPDIEMPGIEGDTKPDQPDPEPVNQTSFSATEDDDYLHVSPEVQESLPSMLVQIALVKQGGDFSGADIEAAMQEVGLQAGAMDIYHRQDSRYPDRVLFSVASLVNPGYFPFDDMKNFRTPGLMLFTQLPGVRDGLEIYSDMLYTANELAGMLGGILQDETHSVLSKQTIQHTKDAILEHRRKLRLAKLHK
ncbi:MAG TPA: cell division protein ZipA [Chromatiaceae bacterium]|nr:cell division protein ZipA [Chromatiaceae bacterium]